MKLFKTAVASFLVMGALAIAMPSPASAHWHDDQWHHDNWHHDKWDHDNWRHEYRHDRDDRYDRDYGYDRGYGGNYVWHRDYPYASEPYAYGNHYSNGYYGPLGHQVLPPNGEGMINKRNPNLIWACNGDGNHCHWARR
jgi:hypothetical protein